MLDVLIIILAVGVVASLLLPYIRTERSVRLRDACRRRMKLISEAEMRYFETAGGKITKASADTSDTSAAKAQEHVARVFTEDVETLRKFLPEGADTFDFVCPLDGRPFIIVARDSFFYSISCPNGHGQIILGAPTWESK